MSWEEYVDDRTPQPGDNAKSVLEGQVNDLWDAEKVVDELTEKLKAAKEHVRRISEDVIPKTLEDMGLEEVTVKGGLKVSIKQSVHASPKAARREELYGWLEEHGHGGLIKRKAIFNVGRGREAEAEEFIRSVDQFPGTFERKVEPMTLRSFVNQCLKDGVEIPMDLFGAYTRRVAEVKSE